MKLPKKIDPDRIKDSIVEVRFTSSLPHEVLLGVIYHHLKQSYSYANNQVSDAQTSTSEVSLRPINSSLAALFYNETIKFEIQPGTIIFNCLNNYPSWEVYYLEIKNVLLLINSTETISNFTRIGLRYISEYPQMPIEKITTFNFMLGNPDFKTNNFAFRTEFTHSNNRVILNLGSNSSLAESQMTDTLSYVDIDVIKEAQEPCDIDQILINIDSIHTVEKQVFFSLIQNDFLNSLNPQY